MMSLSISSSSYLFLSSCHQVFYFDCYLSTDFYVCEFPGRRIVTCYHGADTKKPLHSFLDPTRRCFGMNSGEQFLGILISDCIGNLLSFPTICSTALLSMQQKVLCCQRSLPITCFKILLILFFDYPSILRKVRSLIFDQQ